EALLLKAQEKKMLDGAWAWFFDVAVPHDFHQHTSDPNATSHQAAGAVFFSICCEPKDLRDEWVAAGITESAWMQSFPYSLWGELSFPQGVADIPDWGAARLVYDAIWAASYTLSQTTREEWNSTASLNAEVPNVSFLGASGNVSFTETLERRTTYFITNLAPSAGGAPRSIQLGAWSTGREPPGPFETAVVWHDRTTVAPLDGAHCAPGELYLVPGRLCVSHLACMHLPLDNSTYSVRSLTFSLLAAMHVQRNDTSFVRPGSPTLAPGWKMEMTFTTRACPHACQHLKAGPRVRHQVDGLKSQDFVGLAGGAAHSKRAKEVAYHHGESLPLLFAQATASTLNSFEYPLLAVLSSDLEARHYVLAGYLPRINVWDVSACDRVSSHSPAPYRLRSPTRNFTMASHGPVELLSTGHWPALFAAE
ncbi:hypothetical protein CYMTET_18133, partial [Cymbomonas tetramitiformis]